MFFFFFFANTGIKSLLPHDGPEAKGGTVLIVGHVQRCPFVSWHFGIQCSLLFLGRQLKGKRKLGVRQGYYST